MIRVHDWLAARPALTFALVLCYMVPNLLLHDQVNDAVLWIQARTLSVYAWATTAICLVGLAAFGIWLVQQAARCRRRGELLLYFLGTTLITMGAYVTIFYANGEAVHFLQFGLLALLIHPLTGRYVETVVWTTLAGAVDEGNQYWNLHRHWGVPLDFNDFTLNLLGAGFAVVLLFAVLEQHGRPWPPRYTLRRMLLSPAFVTCGVLLGGAALMYVTGYLRVAADPAAPHAILLRRCPPGDFWTRCELSGKLRHEFLPLEGLAVLAALTAFYTQLDLRGARAAQRAGRAPLPSAARARALTEATP
jgi:hypothetical protein